MSVTMAVIDAARKLARYLLAADDVRRIGAQGSDDLTAVGVAGDDGRAVLAGQHLA